MFLFNQPGHLPEVYTIKTGEFQNVHIAKFTDAQMMYQGMVGDSFCISNTWNKFGDLRKQYNSPNEIYFYRQYGPDVIKFRLLEVDQYHIKFEPVY